VNRNTKDKRTLLCAVEVIEFCSVYLILTAALGSGVHSASNKSEYQKMFLASRSRPVRSTDNLTAICEPIV
jgi:hypothetical protein